MTLPDSLRARVLATAAATPAPSRTRTNLRLGGLGLTGVLWVVMIATWHGRRSDWTFEPSWAMWLPLVNAAIAALVLTMLSVSRGRTMLGPPAAWLLAGMVAAPSLTGAVAVGSSLAVHGEAVWAPLVVALRTSAGSGLLSLVVGVPLVLLFVVSLRGRAVPAPGLLGATAGVCAAAWSHAMLSYNCPYGDPWHLVLGHVVPALPLALFGAWAARMGSRRSAQRWSARGQAAAGAAIDGAEG